MSKDDEGQLKIISTRPPCRECNAFLTGWIRLEKNTEKLDNGDPDEVHMTVCPNCGLKQIVWYPK